MMNRLFSLLQANRTKSVCVGRVVCNLRGVQLGTVLGHLIIILDLNDIPTNIDSEMRFSADDFVCHRKIKNRKNTLPLQYKDCLECWARELDII